MLRSITFAFTKLFLLFLCSIFLSGCLIERRQMAGISMEPTVKNGQHMTLVEKSQQLERGDIVIFKAPPKANCPQDTGCEFIKRVIGIPGDKLSLKDGEVVLNGEVLDEPYVKDQEKTVIGPYLKENPEVTLADNEYFLMGDNRPYSLDSRSFGPVTDEYIFGVVTL